MRAPELPDLAFEIDQFDAMREAMMGCLDMLVVKSVAIQVTRVNAMQDRLLNTGTPGMIQEMMCQARAREALPETHWMVRMRAL
ncbi:hypothetical protein B0G62_10619 [Paraburkholderia eburnea]|uniref:Uncharacterized protein n=1 Tax=Paraburkholderia eburnea TaxID=1189126 RepID=A0A2S4M9R8_9BURK|nr:hypothetical protein [Paraburkholderia eburnea]POR51490.1 hypothetical protein B0G62_10619 [Paraburkholderia eburnea]PRZ22521.1 hypothetical protein BX588_10619 [Paraburkholderia eburnea]